MVLILIGSAQNIDQKFPRGYSMDWNRALTPVWGVVRTHAGIPTAPARYESPARNPRHQPWNACHVTESATTMSYAIDFIW